MTLFNFGRCSEGVGTHRFKKQWGSRDEQLWWYQQGDGASSTPSPDDGAYAGARGSGGTCRSVLPTSSGRPSWQEFPDALMSWRYLPPAHSPASAGSIAGGLRGMMLGGQPNLDQWLAQRYEVDAALLLDSGTSALRLALESVATGASSSGAARLRCYDLATAADRRWRRGLLLRCRSRHARPRLGLTRRGALRRSRGARARPSVRHSRGSRPCEGALRRAGAVVIEDAAQGAGAGGGTGAWALAATWASSASAGARA